jgi:hypothetical protein
MRVRWISRSADVPSEKRLPPIASTCEGKGEGRLVGGAEEFSLNERERWQGAEGGGAGG